MKNEIFIQFQNIPHQMHVNYKGNSGNVTVEKPGRHHVNQVVKVSTTSYGTN